MKIRQNILFYLLSISFFLPLMCSQKTNISDFYSASEVYLSALQTKRGVEEAKKNLLKTYIELSTTEKKDADNYIKQQNIPIEIKPTKETKKDYECIENFYSIYETYNSEKNSVLKDKAAQRLIDTYDALSKEDMESADEYLKGNKTEIQALKIKYKKMDTTREKKEKKETSLEKMVDTVVDAYTKDYAKSLPLKSMIKETVLESVQSIENNFNNKSKQLVFSSYASGSLRYEYCILKTLIARGFTIKIINIIDIIYKPGAYKQNDKKFEQATDIFFKTIEEIDPYKSNEPFIQTFRNEFLSAHLNIFSSLEAYTAACLTDNTIKSDIFFSANPQVGNVIVEITDSKVVSKYSQIPNALVISDNKKYIRISAVINNLVKQTQEKKENEKSKNVNFSEVNLLNTNSSGLVVSVRDSLSASQDTARINPPVASVISYTYPWFTWFDTLIFQDLHMATIKFKGKLTQDKDVIKSIDASIAKLNDNNPNKIKLMEYLKKLKASPSFFSSLK